MIILRDASVSRIVMIYILYYNFIENILRKKLYGNLRIYLPRQAEL